MTRPVPTVWGERLRRSPCLLQTRYAVAYSAPSSQTFQRNQLPRAFAVPFDLIMGAVAFSETSGEIVSDLPDESAPVMTCACLCFLLQGEPLRNRAPAPQQDDRLHHGAVRHGAHLQRSGAQAGQAHYPEDGRGPHEGPQRSVTAPIFCFSFAHFLCSFNFRCVCVCSCARPVSL